MASTNTNQNRVVPQQASPHTTPHHHRRPSVVVFDPGESGSSKGDGSGGDVSKEDDNKVTSSSSTSSSSPTLNSHSPMTKVKKTTSTKVNNHNSSNSSVITTMVTGTLMTTTLTASGHSNGAANSSSSANQSEMVSGDPVVADGGISFTPSPEILFLIREHAKALSTLSSISRRLEQLEVKVCDIQRKTIITQQQQHGNNSCLQSTPCGASNFLLLGTPPSSPCHHHPHQHHSSHSCSCSNSNSSNCIVNGTPVNRNGPSSSTVSSSTLTTTTATVTTSKEQQELQPTIVCCGGCSPSSNNNCNHNNHNNQGAGVLVVTGEGMSATGSPPGATGVGNNNILSDDSGGEYSRTTNGTKADEDELISLLDQIARYSKQIRDTQQASLQVAHGHLVMSTSGHVPVAAASSLRKSSPSHYATSNPRVMPCRSSGFATNSCPSSATTNRFPPYRNRSSSQPSPLATSSLIVPSANLSTPRHSHLQHHHIPQSVGPPIQPPQLPPLMNPTASPSSPLSALLFDPNMTTVLSTLNDELFPPSPVVPLAHHHHPIQQQTPVMHHHHQQLLPSRTSVPTGQQPQLFHHHHSHQHNDTTDNEASCHCQQQTTTTTTHHHHHRHPWNTVTDIQSQLITHNRNRS